MYSASVPPVLLKLCLHFNELAQRTPTVWRYTGPKFYPNSRNCFKFSGDMKALEKNKNAFRTGYHSSFKITKFHSHKMSSDNLIR